MHVSEKLGPKRRQPHPLYFVYPQTSGTSQNAAAVVGAVQQFASDGVVERTSMFRHHGAVPGEPLEPWPLVMEKTMAARRFAWAMFDEEGGGEELMTSQCVFLRFEPL